MSQEDILNLLFSKKGLLASFLKDYEEREEQIAMTRQILEAYDQNQIACIEAGTGTGKSISYLAPAIFWALNHKEKTIISTHTISLQEQLLHKDIPLLLKVLDVDIKVVLVKGMANYLCLKKLEESSDEDLISLERWSEKTQDGSKSDAPAHTLPLWPKVAAESESCTHVHCPHYKRCFFFRARRQAQDAQVLIVNHHLLLTDLKARMRNDENKAPLPACDRIVIDEAHHLEEIAIEILSERIDKLGLYRTLSRLSSIEEELLSQKRQLSDKIAVFFHVIEEFIHKNLSARNAFEKKWRLKSALLNSLKGGLFVPLYEDLLEEMKRFIATLYSVKEKLKENDAEDSEIGELESASTRLEEAYSLLENFFSDKEALSLLRLLESINTHSIQNIALSRADLDIASCLDRYLFSKASSVVLCSATLTSNRSFAHFQNRLGIAKEKKRERAVTEMIYDSPFDYANRTLFLVPTDLPDPTDPRFLTSACSVIQEALTLSEGNAFLLFTSYEMLKSAYEILSSSLDQFHLLKQGDASRHTLIESFKAKPGSVLFGTDSFWEGVDIPGDALRLVVIAKLPFPVPNDPLKEAQKEFLIQEGEDPFMDYALPEAVVKFKQGYGRLMRKKSDRGCILCLDKRISSKGYGKVFLRSLPQSPTCFEPTPKVIEEMARFYNRVLI